MSRPTDVRRSPGLTLTGRAWWWPPSTGAWTWTRPRSAGPPSPAAADGTVQRAAPGSSRSGISGTRRPGRARIRTDTGPSTTGRRSTARCTTRGLTSGWGTTPRSRTRAGHGTHGTHVLDIAAGNGQAGGPVGIAPDADLIFVHLADRNTGGLANFGDSVRLLEAVDFISRTAGSQPCVINISAGRICGPKDGTTLVERALDELLAATPGRFVVNSAGNYFGWRTHSCGRIAPGETRSLTFVIDPADITLNELEIWYDGADEFAVRIDPPGYAGGRAVRLGERSDLLVEGRVIGRVYHRKHDPNNGDNHIVAYIDPDRPRGELDGHPRSPAGQRAAGSTPGSSATTPAGAARRGSRPDDSSPVTTIGTIATSHLPLVVGAYDGHDPARPVAPFSSSGPSRDVRDKPDLVAPGVDVLAARSAPVAPAATPACWSASQGTSMATPHVTGAVALCLEAAGDRLSARQIRSLVLGSCDPVPDPDARCRLGHGYLNIPRLVADVQQALAAPAVAPTQRSRPWTPRTPSSCSRRPPPPRTGNTSTVRAASSPAGSLTGSTSWPGQVSAWIERYRTATC